MTNLIIVHRGSVGPYTAPEVHKAVIYADYLWSEYKGHNPIRSETFQSESYRCGDWSAPPHYPVPVPVDSLTHEAALWYTNHDKWWDYRIEKRRRGEGDRP